MTPRLLPVVVQLDLAIRSSTASQEGENVGLGQRRAVVVVAEGHAGKSEVIAGREDLLVRDVGSVRETDHAAGQEIDVTHTEGRAGERSAGHEAGGGVLGGSPDFEANRPSVPKVLVPLAKNRPPLPTLMSLPEAPPTTGPSKIVWLAAPKLEPMMLLLAPRVVVPVTVMPFCESSGRWASWRRDPQSSDC